MAKIEHRIKKEYPGLRVAGMHSPPFRPLTEAENNEMVERIQQSGANIVLVSLGCPKQERWMHAQLEKISAVMIGIGAAFPVFAGLQSRAPKWMQTCCLEWLYRLCQEPRRLLSRYLYTNTAFLFLLAQQGLTRFLHARHSGC